MGAQSAMGCKCIRQGTLTALMTLSFLCNSEWCYFQRSNYWPNNQDKTYRKGHLHLRCCSTLQHTGSDNWHMIVGVKLKMQGMKLLWSDQDKMSWLDKLYKLLHSCKIQECKCTLWHLPQMSDWTRMLSTCCLRNSTLTQECTSSSYPLLSW